MKIKNNQILKLFIISSAFVLFSCDKNIQTIGTRKVHQSQVQKTEEPKQTEKQPPYVYVKENCPGFTGVYDAKRFYEEKDDKIRLHDLKCAFERGDDLKNAYRNDYSHNHILGIAAGDLGDLESVKFLIEIVKVDVNLTNKTNVNIIWLAAQHAVQHPKQAVDIIKYLMSRGQIQLLQRLMMVLIRLPVKQLMVIQTC